MDYQMFEKYVFKIIIENHKIYNLPIDNDD